MLETDGYSLLHSECVRCILIEDNKTRTKDPDFEGKLAPEASLSRENCVN